MTNTGPEFTRSARAARGVVFCLATVPALAASAQSAQACDISPCEICVGEGSTVRLSGNCTFDCVDVRPGGKLIIEDTGRLTLASIAPITQSVVDGTVLLNGSGAILAFAGVGHTVSGGGMIVGAGDLAEIDIGPGATFTNGVIITGRVIIGGQGNFTNANTVTTSFGTNGTLTIEPRGTIDDTNGASWMAVATGATLLFAEAPECLEGDFTVANGTLRAGSDPPGGDDIAVRTSGNLTHTGGSIVAGQDDSFCFHCDCPPPHGIVAGAQ